MKCLGENLLFTTVMLEVKASNNYFVGTGFFYSYNNQLFLVTNKHVVEGAQEGKFVMLKGETKNNEWKPIYGKGIEVFFSEKDFVGHPDPKVDVAVANATVAINALSKQGKSPFWMHIKQELIPTEADIEKYITPLEEVVFVGYPSGIWDYHNLLPIMRKGITATPYYIDFMNEKKFLIDASVFPGSSGSPVFIYNNGSYSDKSGNNYNGSRIYFLGIVSKTFIRYDGEDRKETSTQMIDLGEVYKASTVQECIQHFIKKQ